MTLDQKLHYATMKQNNWSQTHMGEICEYGFIEKIGHYFWDFKLLFWQLMK